MGGEEMSVELRRVYDEGGATKGYRVLVDRVWPRGFSKEALRLDEWCREIAPSTPLRKWFGHDPARWESFRQKYLKELEGKGDLLAHLRAVARKQTLVLLYSAKDQERNQAIVIREALRRKLP